MKKKPKEPILNDWQRAVREARMPKPPEGLTVAQRLYFENAAKKIKFTPRDDGGLEVDTSELSQDELFAIGETGTPDWPFVPASVQEKLTAVRRRGRLGEFLVTFPGDAAAEQRLLEAERRTISGSLNDKDARTLAAQVHGRSLSSGGAKSRREEGNATRERVRREAIEVCAAIPRNRIKREAVAQEVATRVAPKPGYDHILKLLSELFPGGSWPPKAG